MVQALLETKGKQTAKASTSGATQLRSRATQGEPADRDRSSANRADRIGVMNRLPSVIPLVMPPATEPTADEVLPLLRGHHQSW